MTRHHHTAAHKPAAPAVSSQAVPIPGSSHEHASTAALVLHVAWMAILLGLVVQILLLFSAAIFHRLPKINPLIVDFAQRIAWSTIVCASISVAMAASKLRESFMGLAGLLSGSLAFRIARSTQKGVAAALGVPPAAGHAPSPWVLGLIKAVEYGCLAALIARVAKRKNNGALAHMAGGLAIGIIFGGMVLGYTYWSNVKQYSVPDAISRGINEVMFPIGCSLVLFFTEVWLRQVKPAPSAEPAKP